MRLWRALRAGLVFGLMAAFASFSAIAYSPDVDRGIAWLSTQPQSNGSVAGEVSSLAAPLQARAETLETLRQLSTAPSTLADALASETSQATEVVARKALVLSGLGRDVSALIALLAARQNADGGYGGAADYQSDPLDTAYVLLALKATGSSQGVGAAIGYLQATQAVDGTYAINEQPSIYATAVALQALGAFAPSYSVSATVDKARNALIGAQTQGAYATVLDNAVASLALVATRPDPIPVAGAASALKASQQADGSWGSDPYLTALALRALVASAGILPAATTGQIAGSVVEQSSGGALAGVLVQLGGPQSASATSDAAGAFALGNLAPGAYSAQLSKAGYATASVNATVAVGVTTNLGVISLQLATTTAVVHGTVGDGTTTLPIGGANVAITGGPSAVTDASGAYQIAGLAPGSATITVSKTGYQDVTATTTLSAGVVYTFSPSLYPVNQTPVGATLKGKIVDRASTQPIAGATVKVGTASTATDAAGVFVLAGLAAGSATIEVSATGYRASALSATLAQGTNDAGTIALDAQAVSVRVSGRITDTATSLPVAGASVSIQGTTHSATADANGFYSITGVSQTQFTLAVAAVGYQLKVVALSLAVLADTNVDVTLDRTAATGTITIKRVVTDLPSYNPYATIDITAELQNASASPAGITLRASIRDVSGRTVLESAALPVTVPGSAPAYSVALTTHSENLPPGPYLAVVRGFDDAGNVQTEASASFAINPLVRMGGGITLDPPIVQSGTNQSIHITANLANSGNQPIPAGAVELTVTLANAEPGMRTKATAELQPGSVVGSVLNWPVGAGFDAQGNFYTVNKYDRRIIKMTPDGQMSVFATLPAMFSLPPVSVNPVDALVDPAGNVHVLNGTSEIFSIDPSGTVARRQTGLAGAFIGFDRDSLGNFVILIASGSTNQIARLTASGSATVYPFSGLNAPRGIVRGADGNLYVTNYGDGTIARVTPDGTISPFVTSGLSAPMGITRDAVGNLYVANSGAGNVMKITTVGVVSIYATGIAGAIDLRFDAQGQLFVSSYFGAGVYKVSPGGGAATIFAKSIVSSPQGLAYDAAGNLYAVGNTLVRKDAADVVTSLPSLINAPRAVAIGPTGDVFIANQGNGTIARTSGSTVTTFASGLESPYGLAFDGAGALYATESSFAANRIVAFDTSTGQKTTVAESLITSPQAVRVSVAGDRHVLNSDSIARITAGGAGSFAVARGVFSSAQSFALTADGGYFIQEDSTIRRLTPTGAPLWSRIGLGSLARGIVAEAAGTALVADMSSWKINRVDSSGTVTAISNALPSQPVVIVDDQAGGLYAQLATGHIARVGASGAITLVTAAQVLPVPNGLALDAAGARLFLTATSGGLRSFDLATKAVAAIPGVTQTFNAIEYFGGQLVVTSNATKEVSSVSLQGTVNSIAAGFSAPGPIAWDGTRLVFTDFSRLLALVPGGSPRILATGSFNHLAARNGTIYGTLADTVYSFTPGVDAARKVFAAPGAGLQGIAIRGDGVITVASSQTSNVWNLGAAGQVVATYPGIAATSALAINGAGDLFVASTGNQQIVRFEAAGGSSSVIASNVIVNGFAFDAGGQLFATVSNKVVRLEAGVQVPVATSPSTSMYGLIVDASGIHVADSYNSMLRKAAADQLVPLAVGLSSPKAVRYETSGDVLVASSGNGTLLRLSNGQLAVHAAGLTQPQSLAFAATGEVLVGGGQTDLYAVDANGTVAQLTKITSIYGGLGSLYIDALAVNPAGTIVSVSSYRNQIDRLVYYPAGSGPQAGTVVKTAQAAASEIRVGETSAPIDFGTWIPPYAGDFEFRLRPLGSGIAGDAVNMLHVGPHGEATLIAQQSMVPPGNATVNLTMNIKGADFTSLSRPDPRGITVAVPEFALLSAMGADASGAIYLATNYLSTVYKYTAAGGLQPFYTAPTGRIGIFGAIPVDDQQNVYVIAGATGSDVIRITPAGIGTVIATLPERVGGLARASGDVLYTVGSANLYRLQQVGGIWQVTTTPFALGPNYALTIDGKDNLYFHSGNTGISVLRPDGTRASLVRPDANGEPSFEGEGVNIAGDCADNLFVTPYTWSRFGQNSEEHTLIQVIGRTGQPAAIFDGLKQMPQLTDMDSIVFDRFSSSLLVWADLYRGIVHRLPVTCGAIDTDLHVVFPAGQSAAGFSTPPKAVMPRTDGSKEYVWSFKDVAASGNSVGLATTLPNVSHGETRAVASEAFLAFRNTFAPGEIKVALPVPSVRADGMIDLAVATDALQYEANTNVAGEVRLTNRDVASAASGTLLVELTDVQGARVAVVSQLPVTIGANQALVAPVPFDTGTYLTGAYALKATLTNTDGVELARGSAGLYIVAGPVTLVASVSTDRQTYNPSDAIAIAGRVRNVTLNSIASGITAQVTVKNPAGQVILTSSATIALLVPQALKDAVFPLKLDRAAAGTYTAELVVSQGGQPVGATQVARFTVISTADTASGLASAVAVTKLANQGDPVTATATLRNQGNAALSSLPVTVRIVNPQTGAVVQAWVSTVSLAQGAEAQVTQTWDSTAAGAGTYAATASAIVGGREIALGQDTVLVGAVQPFAFAAQTDVALGASVASNPVTIGGIVLPAAISVSGGEYRINGGAWAMAPGTVAAGDVVTVRVVASATSNTTTTATLKVATFSTTFSVTTVSRRTTPDPFAFMPVVNALPSATATSNTIAITGIDVAVPISIAGGEYSIDGGPWVSAAGVASNGQHVAVRLVSAATFGTTSAATLTVSNVSAAFSVTTVAEDRTPDPFSFGPRTNVSPSTAAESELVAVTGINVKVLVRIAGGEYSLNGAPYTAAAGSLAVGDTVRVRQTSAPTFATSTTANLTVSEFTAPFNVTTKTVADVATFPTFAAQARVLVLVSCKPGEKDKTSGSGDGDDPACLIRRAAFVDGYLASLAIDHLVVTTTDAFKSAFRSGRYDTYWISGGGTKLADLLVDEVREAAFRGESLIVDGAHDERNGMLDAALGVNYRGKPSAIDTVTIASPELPAGSFPVAGSQPIRVELTTGALLARFNTGDPAISINTYGYGTGLLFAFDLAGTLQAQSTSALLKAVFIKSLGLATPQVPAAFTGGAYVPFSIDLRNAEPVPVDLAVSMSVPAGFTIVASLPPSTPSGTSAVWSLSVAAGATASVEGALRIPEASGTYKLPVAVKQVYGGSTVDVGAYDLTVVVKAIDTEMAATISALKALSLATARDREARDAAVEKLQEAQTAIATARWEDAIEKLLDAAGKLDDIAGTTVSANIGAIDRLLQEVERRWWSVLAPCPVNDGPCRAP